MDIRERSYAFFLKTKQKARQLSMGLYKLQTYKKTMARLLCAFLLHWVSKVMVIMACWESLMILYNINPVIPLTVTPRDLKMSHLVLSMTKKLLKDVTSPNLLITTVTGKPKPRALWLRCTNKLTKASFSQHAHIKVTFWHNTESNHSRATSQILHVIFRSDCLSFIFNNFHLGKQP